MEELETLRKQIDAIDNELLAMLSKRQMVVTKVGEYKQKNNIQVLDEAREKYLYEFHKELSAKYNLSFTFIEQLFALIMQESRRTQSK